MLFARRESKLTNSHIRFTGSSIVSGNSRAIEAVAAVDKIIVREWNDSAFVGSYGKFFKG